MPRYTDISPLRKPLRDAERVADVLKGFGYDVILGRDTKKQELEQLVQQFQAKLANADVGFFFYSGHGFQTNRMDQAHPVNHIVPVDFDLPDGEGQLKTVALDPIVQSLRNNVRVGFIFMDACRNDRAADGGIAARARRLERADDRARLLAGPR